MTVFVANTNILELLGLKSEVEGTFINDATVTVTVKDRSGYPVAGMTWPATMAYVAASSGDYRLTLENDLAFVHKQKCTAYIEVDAGVDRIGHWEFTFTPITRAVIDT